MIDSHHHLWQHSVAEYGWIPPGSSIERDFLLPELTAATQAAGVDGTVVVQARQTLQESDWLLDLADQSPIIRGVVGWVPLIDHSVADPLSLLSSHPKFKAVRHVLQGEPDAYFLHPHFHRGLALLPQFHLAYDLLIFQRQIPVALQLVDRQPNLSIIIDHVAKPKIRNGSIDPAWKAGMTELAKRDNITAVKISGMVTEVLDPAIDEATLSAYFDTTLELFGPHRVMFGTDWPVCLLRIDSYSSWAQMVRRFVSRLSQDEQIAILSGNATRSYRLS